MLKKYSFSRKERLSPSKTIDRLFNSGITSVLHPFKVCWMEVNGTFDYPARVLISIPLKQLKKASKRNLIRRYIKEAYRLNKHILYKELKSLNKTIVLAYIYQSTDILGYPDIEKKLKQSFNIIIKDLV
jgi:ribonuclease P protein component